MASIFYQSEPTRCEHRIHKLWLGNGSDEALMFGVGVKYKYITCNSAPFALKDALQYIKKKTGTDLFSLASAFHTGASFGWHATGAALGSVALSSVAMPAVGFGAFLLRCSYMDSDFKIYTQRFLRTLHSQFAHLNMELRSDVEVLYCKQNVCRWCKSNREQMKIELGGITDGLKWDLLGKY